MRGKLEMKLLYNNKMYVKTGNGNNIKALTALKALP